MTRNDDRAKLETMATLTLNDLPEELYAGLERAARSNGRTVEEEAVSRLGAGGATLAGVKPSLLAAAWRERLSGRDLGDVVDDVRAERAR